MEKINLINSLKTIKKINLVYWIAVGILVIFVGWFGSIISEILGQVDQNYLLNKTDQEVATYLTPFIEEYTAGILTSLSGIFAIGLVILIATIMLIIQSFRVAKYGEIFNMPELKGYRLIGIFLIIGLFTGLFIFISFVMATVKTNKKLIQKIESNDNF